MDSRVKDVMTKDVVSVRETAEYKDIVAVMRELRISAFPVLDEEDHLVGVVSEADLLLKEVGQGALGRNLMSTGRRGERAKAAGFTAAELMSRPAVTIGPDDSVANIGSSVLRGFPVSSSASRTAIAVATGSKTQVYSVAAAGSVIVVLLLFRPVLAEFPEAALGAIVIYAAVRLIDVTAFRRLLAFRRGELVVALSACAGVLVFNILYGVLIAVGISVADLLIRVARPHDAVLGHVPGVAGMHDVDDYPDARTVPGLVVYRYDAPLFFANAEDFRRRALAAADAAAPVRWFVLNVEANVEVDFTALEAVDAVRTELAREGVVFALARVKQDLLARLTAFGLTEEIGAGYLFPTLPTAVLAYEEWARQHPAGR